MKIRWQTQRAKALYALAIPVLLMVPLAVHSTYIMLLLDQVLIYIVCVLGLNYITGLTGQNNLGMGAIFGLGAYTSALLTVRLQVSAFVGLLGAIAMGFVIGQVLGRPSLRVKGIYLAFTTISFGEIVRLLLTNMQGLTYGTLGVSNIPAYNFFGIVLDTEHKLYYLFLAVVILSIIICNRIVHSRWGREFRAIRDNDESIPSLGINITRVKIIAFTLCAVFGCIAGALYAHLIPVYLLPACPLSVRPPPVRLPSAHSPSVYSLSARPARLHSRSEHLPPVRLLSDCFLCARFLYARPPAARHSPARCRFVLTVLSCS